MNAITRTAYSSSARMENLSLSLVSGVNFGFLYYPSNMKIPSDTPMKLQLPPDQCCLAVAIVYSSEYCPSSSSSKFLEVNEVDWL